MAWVRPKFTRAEVDRAGMIFRSLSGKTADDFVFAYEVLENWRASHAFPLNTIQMSLRKHARNIEKSAMVSQRLKRLVSMIVKLRRFSTLNMSQMQDIGGARAVVSSNDRAFELHERLRNSRMRHELAGVKDYITCPKRDGYRGIHMIYKYIGRDPCYDRMRIEVQIRTQTQHIWATAVESIGAVTGQALKSNQGDEDWLRFFSLVSSFIAKCEKMQPVPNTPAQMDDLKDEIRELSTRLHVRDTLKATQVMVTRGAKVPDAKFFLVHLDPRSKKLTISSYKRKELPAASQEYTKLEEKYGDGDDQIALVSTENLAALRRAYPNYFLDTRKFLEILDQSER